MNAQTIEAIRALAAQLYDLPPFASNWEAVASDIITSWQRLGVSPCDLQGLPATTTLATDLHRFTEAADATLTAHYEITDDDFIPSADCGFWAFTFPPLNRKLGGAAAEARRLSRVGKKEAVKPEGADLTIAEACGQLGLSENTVRKLLESGELEGYDASEGKKQRKRWRVPMSSIRQFRADQIRKTRGQFPDRTPKYRRKKKGRSVKRFEY